MSVTTAPRRTTGRRKRPDYVVAAPIRKKLIACGCAWCLRLNRFISSTVIRAYAEYEAIRAECLPPLEHNARASDLLERTEINGRSQVTGIKLMSREDGSHVPMPVPSGFYDDDPWEDRSQHIKCRGGNCGRMFEPRNPGDILCPTCAGDAYR